MVRLMFVDKSRPLAHSGIRFPDAELAEYETDGEGRISVDLGAGDYRVEVETPSGWVEREFSIDEDSGLVVVDLRDSRANIQQTRQYFDTGGDRDLGDRYEFLGELGRGGMGVVVRARDTLLNRDVAVKILTPELQGSDEAERIFLTEARSMAKLSHANLVAVHDVISEDGHSMMVVEFITGNNLEEVINEKGSLSQKAVINIGIQVCRVIDYLHSEGIIHRDLKPANLMIEGDGTVKLIDFGLARSLEQIANRGTKIRGTPAYMAPEQVLGDDLSVATDIYQIGVTLFEALTGGLPFAKGDVAYQHVHKEPPTTEEAGNNIFPALAELVDSCLAKDPDDRPESASALMEQLQAVKKVLTSGRISAVQLSDSGLLDDSAGQPASTPQPAEIAQTTGAATGGGSLPEVSSDGAPQKVADSDDTQAPAASGPTRWLWPAMMALALVAGAAFFFGNQLVGGQGETDAAEDQTQAHAEAANTAEDEDAPAAPDVGDDILAARAVSSAGQVVQSANGAARAVVEWAPAKAESSSDDSGDEAAGGRRARGDEASSGAAPNRGGRQAPDRAEQTDQGRGTSEVSKTSATNTGENAPERSETPSKSNVSETSASEKSGSEEVEAVDAAIEAPDPDSVELVPDDENVGQSEAESAASASPDPETSTGGTDNSDKDDGAEGTSPSEPAGVASESDSDSSEKEDEQDAQEPEKEREKRSAPVSF